LYDGDWINDYRTGNGVFTTISGEKYEGEFKMNKKHGKGKYYRKDGSFQEGEWIEDKFQEPKKE
jgi:hypothetical protein